MTGTIQDMAVYPAIGVVASFLVGLLVYLGWRHNRGGRERRKYCREREQQRREYWGWDA